MGGYVGIPASYTPIEYIESDGKQTIDTKIVRDIAEKYRFVARLNWNDVATRQCIGAQGYVYFGVTNGYYQIAQGGTTHTSVTAVANMYVNIDLTFDCPNSTCTGTVNNQSIGTISVTYQDNPAGAKIHLFSLNDLVLPSKVKISSFKIYENDVLKRDFIPVIDERNKGCLFDLVENKFYYNITKKDFNVGAATGATVEIGSKARKIRKIYAGVPLYYTPIEYIESDGDQWIDTGFKPNQNTRVICDFTPTLVDSSWRFMFGSRNEYHNADYVVAYNNSAPWCSGFGSADIRPSSPSISENTRYLIDKNKSTITINSVTNTNTSYTFQSNYNMSIFVAINNGMPTNKCYAKLYSFKVYDNGALIRDYIPVLDYKNEPCLFDKVDNTFYYNSGTGSFIAGNVSGDAIYINDYAKKVKKGYIGVNGVARLCYILPKVEKVQNVMSLINPVIYLNSASIGGYALFAGGTKSNWTTQNVNTANAYSKSLVRTTAPNLDAARKQMASGSNSAYAIFAGGSTYSSYMSNTDAYNISLVRNTTVSCLSTARMDLAGASINNYVLCAGGSAGSASKIVEAYNSSLTKSTLSNLTSGGGMGNRGCSNSHYAVFLGSQQGSTYYTTVDAYNTSLAKTTATSLSETFRNGASASTNDYFFVHSGVTKAVNAYDNNLVRTVLTSGFSGNLLIGASTSDLAFFAGGTGQFLVEVYNNSLVREFIEPLDSERGMLASATIDNYVIFGGGGTGNAAPLADVDAYEIN